jgi:hypothetical protein
MQRTIRGAVAKAARQHASADGLHIAPNRTFPSIYACPYRKLNPDVLLMQSAENWDRDYTADRLNRS